MLIETLLIIKDLILQLHQLKQQVPSLCESLLSTPSFEKLLDLKKKRKGEKRKVLEHLATNNLFPLKRG